MSFEVMAALLMVDSVSTAVALGGCTLAYSRLCFLHQQLFSSYPYPQNEPVWTELSVVFQRERAFICCVFIQETVFYRHALMPSVHSRQKRRLGAYKMTELVRPLKCFGEQSGDILAITLWLAKI